MKPIVALKPPASVLFPSDERIGSFVSSSVFSFSEKAILFNNKDLKEVFSELISSDQNPKFYRELETFLRHSPVIDEAPGRRPDYSVVPPANLGDALRNEKFAMLVASRSGIQRAAESPEQYFDRAWRHLVNATTGIEVLDAYALSNLLNDRSGTYWFVIRKLSRLPLKLRLHSCKIDGDKQRTTSHIQKLATMLQADPEIHPEFKLSVFVSSVEFDPHDRHVRIELSKGAVCLNLTKGLGVFDYFQSGNREVIDKDYSALNISEDAYKKARELWRGGGESNLEPLADFVFSKSAN